MMINSIAALPRLPLRFSPLTLPLFSCYTWIAASRAENCRANSLSVHARLHNYLRSLPPGCTPRFPSGDAAELRSLIDPNTDQKPPHSRLDSHWSTVLCSGSYPHILGGNRDRGRHTFREDWR
jgi:hypothetical protein